jgi:hypothetical protein
LRFAHDLVDLVALGADEQGDHAFWYKDDDTKLLSLDLLKHLVDVSKEDTGTLVFFFHLFIIDLKNI